MIEFPILIGQFRPDMRFFAISAENNFAGYTAGTVPHPLQMIRDHP